MKKLFEDKDLFYLDCRDVKVREDRVRKEFDKEELEALKSSITTRGQMTPILLDDEGYLIAGERRLRACSDLGWEILATKAANLDILESLELELHENFARSPLNAVEECLGFFRLHKSRQENSPGGRQWGVRKTAELTGVSKSTVEELVTLGEAIHKSPQMFLDCKTKTDIKKKIKSEQAQEKWMDLQDEAKRLIAVAEMSIEAETDYEKELFEMERKGIQEGRLPLKPMKFLSEEEKAEREQLTIVNKMKEWDMMTMTGDTYEEFPKMRKGTIGVLFLDPPWGINLHDKVEDGKLEGKSYKDEESVFLKKFPTLCEIAFEKMREDSHLYCFFGIRHYEFVYSVLEECKFITNRRPIILIKDGVKSTRSGNYWPGATYECIAFARKGKRELVKKAPPDHFIVKWHSSKAKMQHPSAKPVSVYAELLARSAYPADIVVDPFYGIGGAFVACELKPELHLRWWGWDIDKENKAKAILNLTQNVIKGGYKI